MTAEGSSPRRSPHLILASSSPRRRQLLKKAGYTFEIVSPVVQEILNASLTIREITTGNATRKVREVAQTAAEAVVLGADTLVTLEGRVIGKPADKADAAHILQRLSGRWHEVWTAVFICQAAARRSHSFQEVSRVRFRKLDGAAIAKYLEKIDPLDKAGAYAAQGHGSEIIERIDGSYSNVVGLPMEETVVVLSTFGISARPLAQATSDPAVEM